MIYGIGVDIIEIARIARAAQDEEFGKRVFTPFEQTAAKGLSFHLAGCFAAKEALLKAMATGLAGFSWQEIEVRHEASGAPYLQVSGKVQQFLTEHHVSRIHLSISHSKENAVAQVILEEQ